MGVFWVVYARDDFKSRGYYTFQFQMEEIVDRFTNEICKTFIQFIFKMLFPAWIKSDLLKIDK